MTKDEAIKEIEKVMFEIKITLCELDYHKNNDKDKLTIDEILNKYLSRITTLEEDFHKKLNKRKELLENIKNI